MPPPMFSAGKSFFTTSSKNYAQVVMEDNPVAFWRLQETSGTTAVDETGSFDGSYINTPTLGKTGRTDGLLAFASNQTNNEYMQAPAIGTQSNFTVSLWAKRAGAMAASAGFISDIHPSFVNFTIAAATGTTIYAGIFNVGWNSTPAVAISDGVWYHLAATYDGSNLILYIDGVEASRLATSVSAVSSGTGVRIGSRWDLSDEPNADISEAAVFGTALSPARILEHYNAGYMP